MRILSTPHAHTTYVDGKNSVREMIEGAIQKGFQSLGFSEHARQSVPDPYGLSLENEVKYIAEVRALSEEYRDRIRVWLGAERDYFAVDDPKNYDFTLASVHYLDSPKGFVAADGGHEGLCELMNTVYGGNGLAMAKAYFDRFAEHVEKSDPSIIAHFDVLSKYVSIGHYFDEDDPAYTKMGCEALERMLPHCDLLEINTGAIPRTKRTTPYPYPTFLTYWKEHKGRIIIGSDCHFVPNLDAAYDLAYEWAQNAGYKTAWALGTKDVLFEEYLI